MKKLKNALFIGTITVAMLFIMTTFTLAATIKVTGDTLNIRKGPSTDTNVVAMLYKGTECELLEEEDGWYKIKYKNYTGYVSKQYAEIIKNDEDDNKQEVADGGGSQTTDKPSDDKTDDNNTNNGDTTVITKKFQKDSQIKLLPLIHSSNLQSVKKSKEVTVICETNGWTYVQTDEISGWVRTDSLSEASTTSGPNTTTSQGGNSSQTTEKVGYINEDYVNVRTGAGTSNKVIKVLTLNSQVTIIGEDNGWYKVKSGSDTGYISKEFVSDSKKTTSRSLDTSRTEEDENKENSSTNEENASKNEEEKLEKENNTNEATNKENDVVEAKQEELEKENIEESKDNQETSKENAQNEDNKDSDTDKNNEETKTKATDVVAYAKKYLGHKYVYGGDGSNGTFDCSGFTMYVYKHFGISLPHGATSQYKSGKGTKIDSQSELEVGDIVFLTDYETGVGIGHCGIYIGNGNFIHASTTSYTVKISSLNTTYKGRFYAGLRLI